MTLNVEMYITAALFITNDNPKALILKLLFFKIKNVMTKSRVNIILATKDAKEL